jgi:hypothetical protein
MSEAFYGPSRRLLRILPLVLAMAAGACGGEIAPPDVSERADPILFGPVFFGGHDYLFFMAPASQADADHFCAVTGGTLVKIDSQAEQTFLTTQENDHGGGAWWIGYSDAAVEGLWQWPDGTTNGYANWMPQQPDNSGGNEDCAADNWDGTGQWNDANCGDARPFVCERGAALQNRTTGSFTYSVTNTNSANQNYASWSIGIKWGVTVGTCGTAGATNSGDTYLRLFDQHGVQVTWNDDSCGTGGVGSNISWDTLGCPLGCTYTVHAGCFSSASCSGTVTFQSY